jgi:putative YhbY family RNA-binding protein
MTELTAVQRRAYRAQAHILHPVASVSANGLTPAVLKEIDVALQAHELIKVRVYGEERAERELILSEICNALQAAAVQHIGKTLVIWRQRQEREKPAGSVVEKPRKAPSKSKSAKALSSHRGMASLKAKTDLKKPRWFPAAPKVSRGSDH